MHARGVIETLNVGKHVATCLFTFLEAATVGLLDLQAAPLALHRCIAQLGVLTVSGTTHCLPIALVLQVYARLSRCALTPKLSPFAPRFWVIPARSTAILSAIMTTLVRMCESTAKPLVSRVNRSSLQNIGEAHTLLDKDHSSGRLLSVLSSEIYLLSCWGG